MKGITDRKKIFATIERHGLYLQQDKTRASLISLVTGEALDSSWWSHRHAHAIFEILEDLSENPEIIFCKLVASKVTLIHRRLWPAVYTIGVCREPWQVGSLGAAERKLLAEIELRNSVENPGKEIKKLEKLILVHSRQVHSPTGKHVIIGTSWKAWARENKVPAIDIAGAKSSLTQALLSIGGKERDLPWA